MRKITVYQCDTQKTQNQVIVVSRSHDLMTPDHGVTVTVSLCQLT